MHSNHAADVSRCDVITTISRSTCASCMTLPETIIAKLSSWTKYLLCEISAITYTVQSDKWCYLEHRTHLFSAMATNILESRGNLRCCFPSCASLILATLVEGFNVSKNLKYWSIGVSNSLNDRNSWSAGLFCHSRRVWLFKRSTTSRENTIPSNGCYMFNAFNALKLLPNALKIS